MGGDGTTVSHLNGFLTPLRHVTNPLTNWSSWPFFVPYLPLAISSTTAECGSGAITPRPCPGRFMDMHKLLTWPSYPTSYT
eukprot:22265_6